MNVVQEWVSELTMMQQTVLLEATRGPDGLKKYHPSKYLLRWYRRCILVSAMDGAVITDPLDSSRGGSFTGPIPTTYEALVLGLPNPYWEYHADAVVTEYLQEIDEVPHHFQLHIMHAFEILGYKHPDRRIRKWWCGVYVRLVRDMHLNVELEEQLDYRLGDSREQWLEHADEATRA